jgi:uncharacterized membrane protein YfcA
MRADRALERVTGEEQLRRWLRARVHERPLAALAVAGAAGVVLGGAVLRTLGRLLFAAAVGYVANELWHREGKLDLAALAERLGRRNPDDAARRSEKFTS